MAAPSSAREGEGLSVQTLIVASAASAGAAILVSLFWRQGTIMAAAITPVLVALLREAFHRPAQALSSVRPPRRVAAARTGAGTAEASSASASAGDAAAAGGVAAAGGAAAGAAAARRRHEAETEPFPPRAGGRENETRHLDDDLETRALRRDDDATHPLRDGESHDEVAWPLDETRGADAETRPLHGADGEGGHGPLPHRGPGGDRPTEPLIDFTRPLEGPGHAGDRGARAHGEGALPPSSVRRGGSNGGGLSVPQAAGGAAGVPGGQVHRYGRRRPSLHTLRRPRVKIAILTGLLAFLIAAVVLTVPELITGKAIGPSSGRTTLFPGTQAGSSQTDGAEDSPIDGGQDDSGSGGADGGTTPDSGGGTGGSTTPDTPSGDSGAGGGSPSPNPPSGSPQPGEGGSSGGAAKPSAPSGGAGASP